jgi:hypothetical protein
MKVLFTGKGSSGSWQIRGIQLAEGLRAIGVEALAVPKASVEMMRSADVIVLVKRPTAELLDTIRASGKPFAWDCVDFWPQPAGNDWDCERALTFLRTALYDVSPDMLICATRDMLLDANHKNSCVIYHHAKPFYIERGKIVNRVGVVKRSGGIRRIGYEGGDYLGRFVVPIFNEMSRRKWNFVSGGDDQLFDSDAAICLRDTIGYAPRHWKSNVKLANAQALGIPALCSPESGYRETSTGGVLWINSPEDLPAAFDILANPARYAELCAAVDAPPTLEQVSRQYLRELERIA